MPPRPTGPRSATVRCRARPASAVPTTEVKQIEVDDIAIGEAILSLLADLASDLLVMGAYGHSRMRELVLGGVTRTLLREMTIPVFMSH